MYKLEFIRICHQKFCAITPGKNSAVSTADGEKLTSYVCSSKQLSKISFLIRLKKKKPTTLLSFQQERKFQHSEDLPISEAVLSKWRYGDGWGST